MAGQKGAGFTLMDRTGELGGVQSYVGLSREAIQNAPEYAESAPITREYENQLYFHYGRPPYWLHQAEHEPSLTMRGA